MQPNALLAWQKFIMQKVGVIGPEWVMFIRCVEPPGTFDQGPGSLPRAIERGGRCRQVVKSYLPALNVGWKSDGVDHYQD
jgi:hypothetical protein